MADVSPKHFNVNPLPLSVKKLWDIWNIRIAVLFSLFLQTVLILLAPNRKRSSRKRIVFTIWSGYLLADATANYAVGLISSNQSSDLSDDNRDLLAFWSPFLLVHLGGPDTITALALEDNELWLRHFLTLIFQAVATLYAFLQSLPKNKLMIPMILMFVSGCIKYLERTRSLYLASIDKFRDSMLKEPDPGPNYAKLMEEYASKKLAKLPTQIIMMPEPERKRPPGIPVKRRFDDLQLVHEAYRLFRIFRGQIVDLIFSFKERDKSRDLFNSITATTALRLIEVELNFIYDVLFTKTMVVHSFMGFFFRFFSFCCLISSLAVFHFHITKHGVFNVENVAVTYTLFLGAVALELIAFLMVVLSDLTVVAMKESEKSPDQNWWRRLAARVSSCVQPAFLKIWSYWTPSWYPEKGEGVQPKAQEVRTSLLFRRWSGCLAGHNLIRFCLKGRPSGIHNTKSNLCAPIVKAISYAQLDWLVNAVGLRNLLDDMTCLSREPLRKNLWRLIFRELRKKSQFIDDRKTADSIASAKGQWVLQESDLDEELRVKLQEYVDVSYDEILLLWHVATELLYNVDPDTAKDTKENNVGPQTRTGTEPDHDPEGYKKMSKTLSDYMLYLLIMQPNIMAAVVGVGKIRFQDTCAEATRFFERKRLGPSQQVKACNYILEVDTEVKPINVKGDRSKSVLFDASMLAKELRKLEGKKWEFISQVWVELLCHAASHGRGYAHAQQLSKGGELITFVWLLSAHFGIGDQFQIKEGHARAKLLVGK